MTEPPESQPPASAPLPEGTPCDILVVDDKPENLTAVRAALEDLDYRLVEAQSGRDALRRLLQQDFALILMDVQMPTMSGFDATRAIREAEGTTGVHVPIVAMTAHAMSGDRDRCLEAGMDDYVTKPVSLATLEGTLRRLFATPAAA